MSGRILAHSNLIEVRQGDSFSIYLQIKKSHKNIDMRGSMVTMQVRDDTDHILLNKSATEIDASIGKMLLRLTPDDTNINVGEYKVDIELTLPDGSVHTIFPAEINKVGIFRITEQVTRQ